MFPLSDTAPRRSFPFVNYLIIAANIFVFYIQMTSPDFEAFTYSHAFIPARFSISDPVGYLTILSSIFMHGGFLHIISNMWVLYIFGDNIEDHIGHIGYLFFYLAGGIVATLGQYFVNPSSVIPMLGASGAIAAVLGAYFLWFRQYKIRTLVPVFFGFLGIIELPVSFFTGYWVIVQLLSGVGSLATLQINEGGIAWFAHVGGFIFGYAFARIF